MITAPIIELVKSSLDSFRNKAHLTMRSKRLEIAVFYASLLVLSILVVAPIWQVRYLPLADIPDHAGQLRIILDYSRYQDDYYINWFTPYLVGYALSLFFSLFLSIPTALKVVLSISLLAVPAAGYCLIRQLGGNRYWVWLFFPIAYSYSFYWGFLSFIVATPVAISTLAFAVWYSDKEPNVKRFTLAATLSAVLFFSHAMAWAMAMSLVPLILWINNPIKAAIRKFAPFIVVAPVIVVWLAGNGSSSGSQSNIELGGYLEHFGGKIIGEFAYVWQEFLNRSAESKHGERLQELFAFAIGKPAALDFVAISIFLLAWPRLIGAKLRWRPKLWLPSLAVIAAFMIVPYWIFDTAYVYYRFAVFLFPAFLFVYQPAAAITSHSPPEQRSSLTEQVKKVGIYLAGYLVIVAVLLDVRADFAQFKQNDVDFISVLNEMETDKNVLTLVFNQDSSFRFTPPYLHFATWYQAEKRGSVQLGFTHDHAAPNVPVKYRHDVWPIPSPWNPSKFNWVRHQGWRYDYYLIRSDRPMPNLFRSAQSRVVLAANHGKWYLYRNTIPGTR